MQESNIISSGISELSCIDDIGLITISNGKKNYITEPEFVDQAFLESWIKDNKIKALIITGKGKHFSNGADFEKIQNANDDLNDFSLKIQNGRRLLDYIESIPVVTIAAINGACFGAGLEIALSCQFRISSENAFYALPEASRGIIPGMNGTERLAKLLCAPKAISIALSGEIMTAETALQKGIVDIISDTDCLEKAISYAKSLTDGRTITQINGIVMATLGQSGKKDYFIKTVQSMEL